MLSRLRAARLSAVILLFMLIGWLAAAPGAALAGTGAREVAGAKCATRSCRAGLPAARSLKATQQPQIASNYCGPATVSEMLRQLGAKVSQSTAAREMKTTRSGTGWSDSAGYPVPDALNADQRRNAYVAVAEHHYIINASGIDRERS